ncbi:MAG: methylmalonyl-CoA mutase family protein, partial [Phycisphaerae bacterium]
PYNNLISVAYQAMAGALGGTQSLHTNSMDETLALPSEQAAKFALRTQQVLAHESNVKQTVDPLGGSYFVEKLTNEIEAKAYAIIDQIDAMGGVLKAIDRGYFRRCIAESAQAQQRAIDSGEQKVVGVTDFVEEGPPGVDILQVTQETEEAQVKRLKELKASRDQSRHAAALERLREDAKRGANLMPALIEGAKADATVGEMMDAMKSVFGAYDGGPEW